MGLKLLTTNYCSYLSGSMSTQLPRGNLWRIARCWRLPIPSDGRFCFSGGRATEVAACDVAENRERPEALYTEIHGDELMLGKLSGFNERDIYVYIYISGQIIATSHDLTPKGSQGREIPLFQGNIGW